MLSIAALSLLLAPGLGLISPHLSVRTRVSANNRGTNAMGAGLSEQITLHTAGRPQITLADGHDLSTTYRGPDGLRQSLEQNQAQGLALAASDFDEDGTQDLISGYAGSSGGILTLQRGNVDAIYPNSPEARTRKAAGQFTNSPFLSLADSFELPVSADFLAAGDFDGDGHKDIVAAARGGDALYFMPGDGKGSLSATKRFALGGRVTALVSGEINRADGLADIIVGIASAEGPKALIFQGARGALRSTPEKIALPAEADAFALGQMDDDRMIDLAVGAKDQLLVIEGRARDISRSGVKRPETTQPIIGRRSFAYSIKSLVMGDFHGDHNPGVALLLEDGTIKLLNRGKAKAGQKKKNKGIKSWKAETLGKARWPEASALVCARSSSLPGEDLLVLDPDNHQIHIAMKDSAPRRDKSDFVSLEVEGDPVAVLPMRLNTDALNDLVVLRRGQVAPTVSLTAPSQVFQVTSTEGGGPGTLRQAILDANMNPGLDTIEFVTMESMPTVFLDTDLPAITDPVVLDGTTEPAFSGTPIVEITAGGGSQIGNGMQPPTSGFMISSGGCTLRGFVINSIPGNAIEMVTNDGNIVEGNFLGTDRTGTTSINNSGSDIFTNNSASNMIGGATVQARNLISGAFGNGITLSNAFSSGNFVQGNFIGTDISGQNHLGSDGSGISIESGSGAGTIGGQGAGQGNLISGAFGNGITITGAGSDVNIVQGNLIGTDASGTASLPNFHDGVGILNGASDNQIGGMFANAGNVISGNGLDKFPDTPGDGVEINGAATTRNFVQGNLIGVASNGTDPLGNTNAGVRILDAPDNAIGEPPAPEPEGGFAPQVIPGGPTNLIANNVVGIVIEGNTATGNRVISNQIFSNDGLGIDLQGDGVTSNDPGDSDTGPNNLQNFPVLTLAESGSGTITIQGTLDSAPGADYIIEFFSNGNCDSSGNGEGENPIGMITVTTDSGGNAQINASFPVTVQTGDFVTATATDPTNNTSEFSACVEVTPATCTITCPNGFTVPNDPGQCSAVVTYPPPTADITCGTVVCDPPSGSVFSVGVTTVTCTTDAGPSCSFIISVNDAEPPVITCPSDIVVQSDPGQGSAVVNYPDPTVTDNCFSMQPSPSGLPGVTCVPPSGSSFPVGTTTVTCTAMDGSGNSANCTFTITVQGGGGVTISCPANIVRANDPGQCSAVVTYPAPVVTGGGPAVCVPPSGSTFQKGTTTVTCTATDGETTAACQFTVTVQDTEPPEVTCPGNITTSIRVGQQDTVVNYPLARVTDNCPGATVVCIPPSGTRFPLGVSTVTCTGRDLAGNTSVCTFTVTVNDSQAPTIECPANIVRDAGGQSAVIVDYPLPIADDNFPNVIVTCNPPSGTAFPVGVTTVTCVATDAAGNQAVCTFTITVTGLPTVRVVIPDGQASVTFGTDKPVRPHRKVKKKKPKCSFFNVENTGSSPVLLTLVSIMRTGPDVEDGTITQLSEGEIFAISLINPDGSETPIDSTTPVTVPANGSVRFCVRFRPLFPPVADTNSGLQATDVVPEEITSNIIFRVNSSQTLAVSLLGIVRAKAVFINPDNPRQLPVLSLTRSGDQFILRYSVFDPNLNVSRAVYQFLDGTGRAVGGPIEVNLASSLDPLNLVRGQSFTVEQRFTGANSHPEVQRVQVTVFDGEGSTTAISSDIGSASAAVRLQSLRMRPGVTIHPPERRLNGTKP